MSALLSSIFDTASSLYVLLRLLIFAFVFQYFAVDPLSVYTVVTETASERNPEPFLLELPKDTIRAGDFYSVPWIIGTVQNEGNLRASGKTSSFSFASKLILVMM